MKFIGFSASILALASLAVSATGMNQSAPTASVEQDAATVLITNTYIRHTSGGTLGSEAGGSVVTVTKKFVPATSVPFGDGSELTMGDQLPPGGLLPNGTNLPPAGNPGDVYTSEYCQPHTRTTIYTFKWVPTPPPGSWQVIKVKNEQDASTTCT